MPELVQVPWQPELYLTPDTLALLVAAGKQVGVDLYIYMAPDGPTDGAWRSWARQNYLYQKALAGGNVASNPNTGLRMHMRGGAFDLVRTDAAVQRACRAVGLIRDGLESWHWNNPRMTSMPIIPVLNAPAGGGGIPIEEEEDMSNLIYLRNSARGDFILDPIRGRAKHIGSPVLFNKLQTVGVEVLTVVDSEVDLVIKMAVGSNFTYPASNGYWINPNVPQ